MFYKFRYSANIACNNCHLRGKCGKLKLLGFVKWWFFVRLLIVQLRWKRRELYAAERAIAGAPAVVH